MNETLESTEELVDLQHVLVPNDILNDFLDGKITGEQFRLLSEDFKTAEIKA